MADDDRRLARLLFRDQGRVYARNQMLSTEGFRQLQYHLGNTPDGYKVDIGHGWEWVIHIEPAGDRP